MLCEDAFEAIHSADVISVIQTADLIVKLDLQELSFCIVVICLVNLVEIQ